MDTSVIFSQVLVLFIVLAVGAVGRKIKLFTDSVLEGMSRLVMEITAPFMIVASFQFSFEGEIAQNALIIGAASFVIHLSMLFVGFMLYRRRGRDERAVLWFVSLFSNAAFMGYPILESVFGKVGVLYGAMYVISFNLFSYMVGETMFSGAKTSIKQMLKKLLNSGIICTVLGFLLFMFKVTIPEIPLNALTLVGSMTTPLSMLVVGARLGDVPLKGVLKASPMFYFTLVLRLALIPLAVNLLCNALGFSQIATGILTLECAMPAAAITTIFAQRYNGDASLAARAVFISTLLSLVSIPIISMTL